MRKLTDKQIQFLLLTKKYASQKGSLGGATDWEIISLLPQGKRTLDAMVKAGLIEKFHTDETERASNLEFRDGYLSYHSPDGFTLYRLGEKGSEYFIKEAMRSISRPIFEQMADLLEGIPYEHLKKKSFTNVADELEKRKK